MAANRMFLVRREIDGTMRTVIAASHRGAMKLFVAKFLPPKGEIYLVKERGANEDWHQFKVM